MPAGSRLAALQMSFQFKTLRRQRYFTTKKARQTQGQAGFLGNYYGL